MAPMAQLACRLCAAHPRRARGVPNRRRRAVRRLRRRPPRGPGALHPAAVRQPPRDRVASGGADDPRSPQRRSTGACRRPGVRARPVEHRDRPRVPRRSASTGSTSTTPRSREPSSSCRKAAWRTAWRSNAGMPRIPNCRAGTTSSTIFEALHDMSLPGRRRCEPRVGCSRTAAASSSPTSGRPSASRWTPGDVERLYYGFSVLHCLSGGDGRRERRGHRNGHARGHGARLRGAGRLRVRRGRADRERLLAVLPADALAAPQRARAQRGRDHSPGAPISPRCALCAARGPSAFGC